MKDKKKEIWFFVELLLLLVMALVIDYLTKLSA